MTGAVKEYTTDMINEHLRGIILSNLTDIIADSGYSAIDLSSKLTQFNEVARKSLAHFFDDIGLQLSTFVIENLSFPEEVEKAIDKSSSLGILGGQMHNYQRMQTADAMRAAADNPGMGGTMFGLGVMGGLGQSVLAGMAQNNAAPATAVGAAGTAKFCPECGTPRTPDAKFCANCGHKF